MAIQVINTTAPGDTAKDGGDKINANFSALVPATMFDTWLFVGQGQVNTAGWCNGTANQVQTFPLFLPHGGTLAKVAMAVNTKSSAGILTAVGIFSTAGAKLFATPLTADGGVNPCLWEGTFASPVWLPPALYILGYSGTGNDTTNSNVFAGQISTACRLLFNAAGTFFGTAANAMDGSGMPATLGTITAAPSSKYVPYFALY